MMRALRALSGQRAGVIALGGRMVSASGALAAMALVVVCLSDGEQGFYYTFQGLVALQILLELGMSGVVLTSVSHEVAALRWVGARLDGAPEALARTATLLRIAAWWYGLCACAVVAVIAPVGVWFFQRHPDGGVAWLGPWLALCTASAAGVLALGVLAFVEGLGRVALAASARLAQSLAGIAAFAAALAGGCGLWSAAIMVAAGSTAALICTARCAPVLLQLARTRGDPRLSWRRDLLPFQWRIALSWIAGYAIFQMMTPAVFAQHGAAAAGRFGLGLQLSNGIASTAGAWLQVRQSPWAQLVARREWPALDRSFRTTVAATLALGLLGAVAALLLVEALRGAAPTYAARLPTWEELLPFLLVAVVNQWVYGLATYLRAHRREPLVLMSVAMGAIMAVACLTLAARPPGWLAWCYCLTTLVVGAGGGTAILVGARRRWHA